MSKNVERIESSQSTDPEKVVYAKIRLLGAVVVRHQGEEEEARAEEAEEA